MLESQAAVRQQEQPEVRLLRRRRLGQGRRRSSKAASSSTDGFPIVIENERGPSTTRPTSTSERQRQGRTTRPTPNVNAIRPGRLLPRGSGQRQDSTFDGTEEVNDTTLEDVSGGVRHRAAGLERPAGDASSATSRSYFSNFLAVPARHARAQHRPHVAQPDTCRPTASAAWCSGRSVLDSNCFRSGTDWRWVTATARKTDSTRTSGLSVIAASRVRRHAAQRRRVRPGHDSRRSRSSTVTLSARVDHWRNYDAHNLETNIADRHADGEQQPDTCPGAGRHRRQPARGGDLPRRPTGSASGATSDRASGRRRSTSCTGSSRVGTVLTLPNNQLGPERLVGGELGVNLRRRGTSPPALTWFDNRVNDPVSNVTISTVGANVTEQRQNLGETEIQGFQTDAEYRWLGSGASPAATSSTTPRSSKNDSQPRPRRQVPAAGAEESRHVPRLVRRSEARDRHVRRARSSACSSNDDTNTRVVPGYSYPGLPAYAVYRTDDHARHRTQRRRLLRRAEPLQPGIHRRHAADDDWIADAGQRRRARAIQRAIVAIA